MSADVVVVGGGYAGVMAANRLTRRPGVTVTLINARPRFVDRIRLHQLDASAQVDFRSVLHPRVRLVVATVTGIDAAARNVRLAGGEVIGYDHLIYAVGSTAPAPDGAHAVATLEEAERLRAALRAQTGPVVVVGGGPTGIETAAELAGRDVTLVSGGQLGPTLHERGRQSVLRQLDRLGVRVDGGTVTAVAGDSVRLADGRVLPGAVTVWTAGFRVPDLAGRSGLSVDPAGRMITDETLTSVDSPFIVATGDAAAPSGVPYRMSCQAAVQLGPQAAETVLSRIDGTTPAPAEVGFAGLCLSLGRGAGIFQRVGRDDRATSHHLGGWAGGRVKEMICRGILWQVRFEARHPGMLSWWTSDPGRAARLAEARR